MNTIQKFDTIHQYNELLGQETLHPLVNVIDLAKSCRLRHGLHSFGFYTVFLKEIKCGNLRYGCNYYDYQEGTLVFLAPGQVIGVEDDGKVYQPQGMALVFHPDLLRGTTLGRTIKDYTFFSYQVNEALHLSEQERHIIIDCFRNIEEELHHTIDKHSQRLIVSNIELFLNYCVRFYDRQFITRENVNKDILTRFENLLNDYFYSEKPESSGLPTVKYCADQMHLSANYFGDLIKKETGSSFVDLLTKKRIETARELVLGSSMKMREIAERCGYSDQHYFSYCFKKFYGESPNRIRQTAAGDPS